MKKHEKQLWVNVEKQLKKRTFPIRHGYPCNIYTRRRRFQLIRIKIMMVFFILFILSIVIISLLK